MRFECDFMWCSLLTVPRAVSEDNAHAAREGVEGRQLSCVGGTRVCGLTSLDIPQSVPPHARARVAPDTAPGRIIGHR
eukprot:4978531-Prymnesium_polylepis.1